VTSALTGSAEALLAVVPDDAEAGAEVLELVREAESEADADAAVVGAADELSLDADCPVQLVTSIAANPRMATVRSACFCIRAM